MSISLNQKAQQIGLALIKVAVQIRRSDLRARLEHWAFSLQEDVAAKDYESVIRTLDIVKELVEFGRLIYQVEPINAQILIQELESFNSAIRQIAGIALPEQKFNLADVFVTKNNDNMHSVENRQVIGSDESGNENGNSNSNHDGNGNGNGNGNGIGSVIRQSAIIEKIRQSGKTALKDLLSEFPDVSERTLRYDLQKLCNQGVIERIGNGGPATYYIVKT